MNDTVVPFHERHDDELLTLDDVATILIAPVNTVRWWRQTSTGPQFFKIGRRLYTTVGDLRSFIRSRRLASNGALPEGEGGARPKHQPPEAADNADPAHLSLDSQRLAWNAVLPQAEDEGGATPKHQPPEAADNADPRHVFLDAYGVMARYGWGKTRGYQHLKDRALVPAPVMTHPDRWRLDQLLAHEEKRIALADTAVQAHLAPPRETTPISDLLPQPKQRRRSA